MTEHEAARDALAERLVEACIAGLDLFHIYIGDQLGLYRALAGAGSLTAAELAARCGIAERYAREWLHQQAVAGILTTSDGGAAAGRRFRLPLGHAEVLTDADSLAFMAPLGQGLAGVARALPQVLDAFRTGGGVEYSAYGEQLRAFVERINRPMFLNQLAQQWFPQVPGLVARLSATRPRRRHRLRIRMVQHHDRAGLPPRQGHRRRPRRGLHQPSQQERRRIRRRRPGHLPRRRRSRPTADRHLRPGLRFRNHPRHERPHRSTGRHARASCRLSERSTPRMVGRVERSLKHPSPG